MDLDVIEVEYTELSSIQPHANVRFGMRIRTSKETYEKDYANLVITVKTKLQQIAQETKDFYSQKSAEKKHKEAIEIMKGK